MHLVRWSPELAEPRALILYHAHCADGFGSAFAAWKHFGSEADYVAVNHGDPPPDVTGRAVTIADFAYPRAIMLEMKKIAHSLIVLDHHKTAEQELAGLDFARFDQSRSGCVLTWNHFHEGKEVPALLRYIQDKDLWQWKLEQSAEVSAALASHPMDFSTWDRMNVEDLRREGVAIRRYQSQLVREMCAQSKRRRFEGHDVPFVNTPVLQSYVGNALARNEAFVVLWHERPDGSIRVSLRSAPPVGIDVSSIARKFGGGGHPQAAGFSLANDGGEGCPSRLFQA